MAGNGQTSKFLPQVKGRLENDGIRYCLKTTSVERNGEALVKELLTDEFTDLLILGGDGTFHEVINGLDNFSCPIGLIQTGTGNDFSKALGTYLKPIVQLERALIGDVTTVDLGVCNGRFFHNGIGIGFDGKVAHRTAALRKNQSGSIWSYYQAVAEGIFAFKSPELSVSSLEHNIAGPHFMVTVGNGVAFGGGFRVTPKAKIDDGLLDVCAVSKVSVPGRLWRLPFLTAGQHLNLPSVSYFNTKTLSISSIEHLPAHIDGETFSAKFFEIQIRPSLLKLRL